MTVAETTFCANHPDRETSLRCNRCGKYICSKCAVRTPTGYRCQECVRGHQKVFDTAKSLDFVLGFVVAAGLSSLAGWLASAIGFFTILLAPAAGGVIAEAVRAVTGRRRSKRLFQIVAAGVILGGIPFLALPLFFMFAGGGFAAAYTLLWPAAYLFIAVPTTYYRLSGIQMSR
ncbi:MAG: B-box zinc finger protein [Anaerolineales bacterium]